MNAHAIPHASEAAVNETTRIAQQDTLLTPRFYTCLLYTSPSPRD